MRPGLDAPQADNDEPAAFDPLADVLFGGVAMVFLALLLLAPNLAQDQRQPAADVSVTVDGESLPVLVASAEGVRPGGPQGPLVPLDAMAGDPQLQRLIATARQDARGRLIVLIEPAGDEAAFVLDPILAAGGIDRSMQLRLTQACPDRRPSARPIDCIAGVDRGVRR